MHTIVAAALVALSLVRATPAAACTCFAVQRGGDQFVARNYDWDFADALVLVNPRGVAKLASAAAPGEPRGWVSRFGSVTFNQYGCESPTGGVNERGLVVEILYLVGTEFPPADGRLGLDPTRWIQYQLDTAASVSEVVDSLAAVRVEGPVPVHFFIADRDGAAAAIEFLAGKPVVHRTGDSMPVAALTNHTYEASEAFLRSCQGWGGKEPIPGSPASLHRFARAADGARSVASSGGAQAIDDLFRVLAGVAQENATQWSIVYDLTHLEIRFRTLENPQVKTVKLADLDFSCRSPRLMADIEQAAAGDLRGRWVAYTTAANRDLIGRSFAKTEFLKGITPDILDRIAAFPDLDCCLR